MGARPWEMEAKDSEDKWRDLLWSEDGLCFFQG